MSETLESFANRPDSGEAAMEPLTHFQEDLLSDLLQSTRVRSTLYCRATMCAPWGLGVTRREVASFHLVTTGTCWLSVEGSEHPLFLGEGDLVILPHGHAHSLTDHPDTSVTRLEDLVPTRTDEKEGIVVGKGRGTVTTLVCAINNAKGGSAKHGKSTQNRGVGGQ